MSADGEAMVHHDDVLGRLTEGEGRLDQMSAAALKRVAFRDTDERMMTLGELCDLVGGRATMLLELKSRFDGDAGCRRASRRCWPAIAARPRRCRSTRRSLRVLRQKAPHLPRGIVAAKYRPHPYWDQMPAWLRYGMGSLLPALTARPQFVAYAIADLPAFAPLFARHVLCLPLLTWVVRTRGRAQRAARWADQMIFEGFRP